MSEGREQGIGSLLDTEMTRRDFLAVIGTLVLTIIGVSSVLNALSGYNKPRQQISQQQPDSQHGFGSRKFGV